GSSSDLLGLLVPALALTDTSAELPAPGLGRPLHGRDDRVQRRRDALTLARPELDLVEARPQALEVELERVVEAPVASGEGGDPLDVDDLPAVAVAAGEREAGEQRVGIAAVLGVELDDLQLGEQQVGGRERVLAHAQLIGQRQPVAHLEGLDERVDLVARRRVLEEQPARAVQRVELAPRLPAQLGDRALDLSAVALRADQVDVVVIALEVVGEPLAKRDPDREPTQKADLQTALGEGIEQPARLDVEIWIDALGHVLSLLRSEERRV